MNECVITYEWIGEVWISECMGNKKINAKKNEFKIVRNLRFSEWMIVMNEMNKYEINGNKSKLRILDQWIGYVRMSVCVCGWWMKIYVVGEMNDCWMCGL